MATMQISSVTKAKILSDASKLLEKKGMVFVNVITKEEIKNIQEIVTLDGEKNFGIYDLKNNRIIGTLLFGNSVYNEMFIPAKIWWALRLSSPLNEKIALSVRSIIEKKGPMIRLRIIAVL